MAGSTPAWQRTVPLALKWPEGSTVCAKTVEWSVDAPYDMGALLVPAGNNSTTAGLFVNGLGVATVTANCDGTILTATVTVYDY